jgi:hypothetical protein
MNTTDGSTPSLDHLGVGKTDDSHWVCCRFFSLALCDDAPKGVHIRCDLSRTTVRERDRLREKGVKKSSHIADNGVHRNRPRSRHISSGKRSGNESGSRDGSAVALQLHRITRKDGRVDSVGLARLRHLMGLGHWWLLSVWYPGRRHPLRLWMQPQFCLVSDSACYSACVIPGDSWRLICAQHRPGMAIRSKIP